MLNDNMTTDHRLEQLYANKWYNLKEMVGYIFLGIYT